MKEKVPTERMLKFHYPEIEKNEALPFNFQFSMHFTKIEVSEEGISNRSNETNHIEIKNLQCKMSEFYVFYKPISRIFDSE